MKHLLRNTLLSCIIALFAFQINQVYGQDEKAGDKEVIIIQETTDAHGNKVIKKITRKGDISDEELEKILADESIDSDQGVEILIDPDHTSGLELHGLNADDIRDKILFLGEGDQPQILGMNGHKATLGILLNTEGSDMIVTSVVEGSGAEAAGVKEGDKILMIEAKEVSSIEDIHDILSDKEDGDQVALVVMRGDEKIETSVELKDDNFRQSIVRTPRWNTPDRNLRINPFGILNRPKLGVLIEDDDAGVLISEVNEDSPAEKAGLKEGDVIKKLNDTEITDTDQLIDLVRDIKAGKTVEIEYLRNGETHKTSAKLGGRKIRKSL